VHRFLARNLDKHRRRVTFGRRLHCEPRIDKREWAGCAPAFFRMEGDSCAPFAPEILVVDRFALDPVGRKPLIQIGFLDPVGPVIDPGVTDVLIPAEVP
jgi:hypothetical protein